MNKRYAFYDFCQTLVDFETADPFIDYICTQEKKEGKANKIYRKCLNIISSIIGHFLHRSLYKTFDLRRIKGLSSFCIDSYAEKYYYEYIKPHLIPKMIDQIASDKKKGFSIVIVSASYEPFVILFAREYEVNHVIANEFHYNEKGIFTGTLKKKDCIHYEKVNRIKEVLNIKDLEGCIAYSDSKSDLPILCMSEKGIVVSHKYHKKWVDYYELQEMIWE